MITAREATTQEVCGCGCGAAFRAFRGELELHGVKVPFLAQMRTHGDDMAAWAALMFARDNETVWATVRARVVGESLQVGMVEAARSPFAAELAVKGARALGRGDVMAHEAVRARVTEAGTMVMRDREVYDFLMENRRA